jgi:micrococcal nuclease
VVRLIGTKAPLSQLASGAEVDLHHGGRCLDRHGHALAQVFVVKGEERVWLQGALAARGLARVFSFPDNHACIKELLPRESEARAKHAGVWRVPAYRQATWSASAALTRSYQLVEGVVVKVGGSRDRFYLNFDRDWHHDFTIVVERKGQEVLKAQGLLQALAGKRLRVRRWIEWRNGPVIRLTHAEQIEVLPDAPVVPDAPIAPVAPHRDRQAPAAPVGIAP